MRSGADARDGGTQTARIALPEMEGGVWYGFVPGVQVAGLASDAFIEDLHRIGVTAVELLPVHAFLDDRHLIERGLSNYWGYNTLSFFAPHQP